MKAKKELINRAVSNGSIDRLNALLSAAHILHCISNNFVEEASDLMKEHGLLIGMIKKRHSDLLQCADRYFNEFAGLVTDETRKMDMFKDMESLEQQVREWAKVPTDWKPKNIVDMMANLFNEEMKE